MKSVQNTSHAETLDVVRKAPGCTYISAVNTKLYRMCEYIAISLTGGVRDNSELELTSETSLPRDGENQYNFKAQFLRKKTYIKSKINAPFMFESSHARKEGSLPAYTIN